MKYVLKVIEYKEKLKSHKTYSDTALSLPTTTTTGATRVAHIDKGLMNEVCLSKHGRGLP